jgi:rfaE bifunctional protein nucleotidyltransferase chain/domain
MLTDKKIVSYEKAEKLARKLRKSKKRIVMVTGCFDILHTGHLIFLNDAKKYGDILVVALGNDKVVRKLKGRGRPIISEKLRSRMLAGLELVDYVVICREKLIDWNIDHSRLVEILKPDIYVVPMTDKKLAKKRTMVERAGGKLIACRRLPPNHIKGGISSTQIEEKLLKL